nr:peroxidase 25 [Tanacetum cinerariifolium]
MYSVTYPVPVIYQVDRLCDVPNFATRRMNVVQKERIVFFLIASFACGYSRIKLTGLDTLNNGFRTDDIWSAGNISATDAPANTQFVSLTIRRSNLAGTNDHERAKSQAGLKSGFYSSRYPKTEATVRSTTGTHFKDDPIVAAALLRLHFHDCFVEGFIDDAKAQLEALCVGVVSCADILALAARDSVDLYHIITFKTLSDVFICHELQSDGPNWAVPTGRREGGVLLASKASNLPSPLDTVDTQRKKFADKGLDDRDLVTLAGA